jgi:hypothetical protein
MTQPVAPSTLKQYKRRLETFKRYWDTNEKECGESDFSGVILIEDFGLEKFKKNIHFLKTCKKFENNETKKGYINALMYFAKSQKLPDEIYNAYHSYFQEIKKACIDKAKEQILPPNRQENYLTKDQLVEAYNKCVEQYVAEEDTGMIPTNYYDHLILALYIVQAPVRADYANMRILVENNEIEASKHIESLEMARLNSDVDAEAGNYAVLTGAHGYFFFQNYKTAKTYGSVKIRMEEPVSQILKAHYFQRREKYVLPQHYTRAHLARVVPVILQRYAGKKCSIGLIRHAWVFDLYKTNPTIQQKEDLARRMLHSVSVQELYRTAETSEEVEEDDRYVENIISDYEQNYIRSIEEEMDDIGFTSLMTYAFKRL